MYTKLNNFQIIIEGISEKGKLTINFMQRKMKENEE